MKQLELKKWPFIAWHARGGGFETLILHSLKPATGQGFSEVTKKSNKQRVTKKVTILPKGGVKK